MTQLKICKKVREDNSRRSWFEIRTDFMTPSISLDTLLGRAELQMQDDKLLLLVAEVKLKQEDGQPESLLANVWHKVLGPRAIPFDPEKREALIAHVCEHWELKRHIKAWQEMKRTG